MASLSFALFLTFVLVIAAEIGRSEQSRDFTITNERYGYLESSGNKLSFAWTKHAESVFTLLDNHAIKDKKSGMCFHLITSTNQQVVLKRGCSGDGALVWETTSDKWLKAQKYDKCLSVWATNGHVAGLNRCAAYNEMLINFLDE